MTEEQTQETQTNESEQLASEWEESLPEETREEIRALAQAGDAEGLRAKIGAVMKEQAIPEDLKFANEGLEDAYNRFQEAGESQSKVLADIALTEDYANRQRIFAQSQNSPYLNQAQKDEVLRNLNAGDVQSAEHISTKAQREGAEYMEYVQALDAWSKDPHNPIVKKVLDEARAKVPNVSRPPKGLAEDSDVMPSNQGPGRIIDTTNLTRVPRG